MLLGDFSTRNFNTIGINNGATKQFFDQKHSELGMKDASVADFRVSDFRRVHFVVDRQIVVGLSAVAGDRVSGMDKWFGHCGNHWGKGYIGD